MDPESSGQVSRRTALKGALLAIGSGTAGFAGPGAAAQAGTAAQPTVAGRRFRAFVRRGTTRSVQELTLRELGPRQVLVRTEAIQLSYTRTALVLGTADISRPDMPGNGCVGIVEAVGAQVTRVQAGDRVIVAPTPQCGVCYACMRGRADHCMAARQQPATPTADLQDGTPVIGDRGFAELMVPYQENCVPVFTTLPASWLAVMQTTALCGLAATMAKAPIEMGADVAVFGAGPVGLAMIQGARIKGASHIIAVEPIPARRELARRVGATIALDPNAEGNELVQKIQSLCASKSDRVFAGYGNVGPDYVLEAVGGDLFPARIPGPDPTGVLPLQQAWQLCSPVGHLVTTGVGHPRNAVVSFPASQWANGAKHHLPGNQAGSNALKDLPSFVRLMETGQYDMRSVVGNNTFPLDRIHDCAHAVADRTVVGAAVIAFT